MTPEEARQLHAQLAAQCSARSVAVCMRPDQVNWQRLPDTIARQLQHTPCADCQVDVVWSPRSTPAELPKVCEPCAQVRLAAEDGQMVQTMYLGPETAPPARLDGQHRVQP